MANTALTFSFSTQELRVIMRDGEPWFVAADVCVALSIQRTSDAVEKLDADEKGTDSIRTLGGEQKMLIVNESGLNAIILRCRDAMTPGTPAHKYRKWVTSEVLPSIRKTGRYVAATAKPESQPEPAPSHTREPLSAIDMNTIRRLIYLAGMTFRRSHVWSNGCWRYMREVLQHPSPNPFYVDQLPQIASTLADIMAVGQHYAKLNQQLEEKLVRRVFRKQEVMGLALASLEREAMEEMKRIEYATETMPSWASKEILALTQRKLTGCLLGYLGDEQPDFFNAA